MAERMMGRRAGPALTLALALAGGAAVAQGLPGDPSRGEALAEAWCAECHETRPGVRDRSAAAVPGPGGEGLAAVEVPAFQSVADDPAAVEMALRAFLRTPHANMPDIRVGPGQADDLVTYILSLKGLRPGT